MKKLTKSTLAIVIIIVITIGALWMIELNTPLLCIKDSKGKVHDIWGKNMVKMVFSGPVNAWSPKYSLEITDLDNKPYPTRSFKQNQKAELNPGFYKLRLPQLHGTPKEIFLAMIEKHKS